MYKIGLHYEQETIYPNTQRVRNEWRSNLWLALELLVVSVVMWYIIDLLYCRLATYMEPRGFDTEHCYLITMGVLTDKSPDYIPYSDTHKQTDEVRELVERLRRRPEVEAVSLSQNFPILIMVATALRKWITTRFMRPVGPSAAL